MARKSGEVNKSEAIRELLKSNPDISAKEAIDTLAKDGIKVGAPLYYFVKGKLQGKAQGKRGRKKRRAKDVAAVTTHTQSVDPVSTILRVKALASEVGGLKKLQALINALSE